MNEGILGFLEGTNKRLGSNSLVKDVPKEILLKISRLVWGKKIPIAKFYQQNALNAAPVIPISLKPCLQCYQTCKQVKEFLEHVVEHARLKLEP
jgi:hypothetical protein